jgi:hypothetical protein
MEKETIAIALSVFSLCVAMTSLGWNIYREIALRARVTTTLAIGDWHNHGHDRQVIFVSAANQGPGPVQLQGFTVKSPKEKGEFNVKHHVVMPDWDTPLTTRLPAMLAVGQTAQFVITYDRECFLAGGVAQIGLTDSFGRVHWTPKRDGARALDQFERDFGSPRHATV